MTTAWEIAGPRARRQLVFDPAVGLYTCRLEHTPTGTHLLARAGVAGRWTWK